MSFFAVTFSNLRSAVALTLTRGQGYATVYHMTHNVHLHSLLSYPGALEELIDQKLVKVQQHPSLDDLYIFNYTPQAQFLPADQWSADLKIARGLILDVNNIVIARGFDKFFNLGQGSAEGSTGPMWVSEKMDGSLGVLYEHDGTIAVATRGSFVSEQAVHATQRLDRYFDENPDLLIAIRSIVALDMTPLFEIVYPENKIVVDYSDRDELVLLDVINNATGQSAINSYDTLRAVWPHNTLRFFEPGGLRADVRSRIPAGDEGFVLYFPETGLRLKVKSEEYVALHRLVTGLSEKSVWEQMMAGKRLDEILAPLPDELHAFAKKTHADILTKLLDIIDETYNAWDEITATNSDNGLPAMMTRKDFALKTRNYPSVSRWLFLVLDGRSIEELDNAILKTLKPIGQTQFKYISEDSN